MESNNEMYEYIDRIRSSWHLSDKSNNYDEHVDFLLGRIAVLSDEVCQLKAIKCNIEEYVAGELAFAKTTGDEYFGGVETTCEEIQKIIAGIREKGR